MISIRSGVLLAVNRPPGCGSISAIWLSGFAGSGFGLLGFTEATSKDTAVDGAAGAAGVCALAVVAVSRDTRATAHQQRMLFTSTFQNASRSTVTISDRVLTYDGRGCTTTA